MLSWVFLMFAVLWAVVQAYGQSDNNSLTGRFGEDITLDTEVPQLHSEYKFLWSYVRGKDNIVIINYENGKWLKNATEKYQLDVKTGALTIRSLTASDSRLYQSQILNGKELTQKKFNLTIVGAPSKCSPTPAPTSAHDDSPSASSADHSTADPDPNPPTAVPAQNRTTWTVVGVLVVLALVSCIVLVVKYREAIKGKCRGPFMPCDPEDPGRFSEQENERDTPV